MTALCANNGPSRPKYGVGTVQTLTADGIAGILLHFGLTWAAGIGAGLTAYSIIVDDLCSTDPPPAPTIDANWIAGFFGTFPSLSAVQYAKDIENLISHYLWYDLCECVSGPQPPVPPPIPKPPGYETDSPRLTSPTGKPCTGWNPWAEQASFDSSGNVAYQALTPSVANQPLKWVQVHFTAASVSGPAPYPITWTFRWTGPGGAPVYGQLDYVQTEAHSFSDNFLLTTACQPGAVEVHATGHTDVAGATVIGIQHQFSGFCSDLGPSLEDPCCPPDPQLLSLLGQIYRLEQQIYTLLSGVGSFAPGPVHSARTGSGSIPVSQLRGIRAHVVTGIPSQGQLPGNPPYEWNLGWMSVMTGDGMIEEKRLTRGDQIWLPTSMPFATTFGYYLNPGIVVDFTELVPA